MGDLGLAQIKAALAEASRVNHPELPDVIGASCAPLVQGPEHFAQTGVGWALRELSLIDRERLIAFDERHLERVSREGMRYITEKMSP
jgi:hypothetical protein